MLGNMIRKLRKQKDFSQSYLGELLNLSASTIGMYEQNRRLPDLDTIINLCKIFSVSSDYILEISDIITPYQLSNDSETIQKRIFSLIEYNSLNLSDVVNITKIRKQRLDDILTKNKTPDVNELILLAECFSESTDYLLGLTDEHKKLDSFVSSEDTFSSRLYQEMNGNLLEVELSEKLNIPISTIKAMLTGSYEPDSNLLFGIAQIFQKSTDYFLGLAPKSRSANINGTYPFEVNDISLKRIQHLLKSDNDNYLENELGLHEGELYLLYHYGFIPHISIINKLCQKFSISSDYLLGISDSKLSIIVNNNINEDHLLKTYRQLDKHYQKKIDGELSEQLLQQERDAYMRLSVAADEPLRKTGTDWGK